MSKIATVFWVVVPILITVRIVLPGIREMPPVRMIAPEFRTEVPFTIIAATALVATLEPQPALKIVWDWPVA